jgi:hypothetical protein
MVGEMETPEKRSNEQDLQEAEKLKEAKETTESSQPLTDSLPATAGRPGHIMISYSWACKKDHVVALDKKLRELGYDVWRDEEGSSLVPGLVDGEVTVETTAKAAENAHTVVICVSQQYKDSVNCGTEAKYALALSKPGKDGSPKLVYVMMDEQYHTRSSPRQVDGWLGMMVGTELWYPLWDTNQVESTAKQLSNLIGNNAKLPAGSVAVPVATKEVPVEEKKTNNNPPLKGSQKAFTLRMSHLRAVDVVDTGSAFDKQDLMMAITIQTTVKTQRYVSVSYFLYIDFSQINH